MQGNIVKAAVWMGASMVLSSMILVVGFYLVVASQAQRTEQALLQARSPVETTIKLSGLEPLNQQAYEGMTLPTAKYMDDDVAYFPKTPDFKWANTSNAMESSKQSAETEESEAASAIPRVTPADPPPSQSIEKLLDDSEALRVGVETTVPPPALLDDHFELQPIPTGRVGEPRTSGDDE